MPDELTRTVRLIRHPGWDMGWHLQEHDETGPVGPPLVPHLWDLRFRVADLRVSNNLEIDSCADEQPKVETKLDSTIIATLYLDMNWSARTPTKLSMFGTDSAIEDLRLQIRRVAEGDIETVKTSASGGFRGDFSFNWVASYFYVEATVNEKRFDEIVKAIANGATSGFFFVRCEGLYSEKTHHHSDPELIKVLDWNTDFGLDTTDEDDFEVYTTGFNTYEFSLRLSATSEDPQVAQLIAARQQADDYEQLPTETPEEITHNMLTELIRGQNRVHVAIYRSISALWAIAVLLVVLIFLSR